MRIFQTLVLLLAFKAYGQTLTITGEVTDIQYNTINNFHAILLNPVDSAIITGKSFSNGVLSFEGIAQREYLLKISCIGYEEKYIRCSYFDNIFLLNLGQISLSTASYDIDAIQVTSNAPRIVMQNDKLIFTVENTVFSDAGTAFDALSKTPYVFVDQDGEISVSGRGKTLVLVNGKRVRSSDELRLINSSQIVKVEIIENPSAKYEAEGHAIINIITIKRRKAGFNSGLFASYRQGKRGTTFISSEVSYVAGPLSSYLSMGYQNYNSEGLENTRNKIDTAGFSFISDTYHFKNYNHSQNYNYSIGVDYSINSNHTIGFQSNGYINSLRTNAISNMDITRNSLVFPTQQSTVSGHGMPTRFSININYSGKISSLIDASFLADMTRHNEENLNDIVETNLQSNYFSSIKTSHQNFYDLYSLKFDGSLPLIDKTVKLEFGAKYSFIENINSFDFTRIFDGTLISDPSFTNNVTYSEQLVGLYSVFSGEIKKWSYSTGLRYELLYYENILQNVGDSTNQDPKGHLFPNATISYKHNDNFSSRLVFSRRISRPNYSSLNNSLRYIDSLSVRKGNPFLEPTIYNAFSSNLSLFKKVNIGLSYSFIQNPTDLVFINDKENIERRTVILENTGNTWAVGANLNGNFSFKNWKTQPFISFSYQPVYLTEDDVKYTFRYPSYSLQWNNQLNILKEINLEIGTLYRQPAGSFKKFGKVLNFDFGANKKIFNNSLILQATYHIEAFPWTQYHNYSYKYCYVVWNGNNRHSVTISLRYNFSEKQPSFKKKSASEDEIKRM